jgi:hypothetical protein
MYQRPPYTLTENIADYLAKIVETVTRLEVRTDFKRDIRLHRENRVRSIYSSLAIEGNTLSLDEVTDVLNGKLVAGKQVEIKEVKNAFAAYDKIMTFDPYKVKDFLIAHKLMTDGLIAESGRFRSGAVAVLLNFRVFARRNDRRDIALRHGFINFPFVIRPVARKFTDFVRCLIQQFVNNRRVVYRVFRQAIAGSEETLPKFQYI